MAENGKPSHAAQHLVDCISLINPCLQPPPLQPSLPPPPYTHTYTQTHILTHAHRHTSTELLCFLFSRRQRRCLGFFKKYELSFFGLSVSVHHTSALGRKRAAGGDCVDHSPFLPGCQMSRLAELHTVMVLTK